MSRLLTLTAIATCYFVFAILLNSVGTVILQSINSFEVSKPTASTLEGFKDLSIAFVSFFVASLIPRIGYKNAILFGLSLVAFACLLTPLLAEFWVIKLLFACIGIAFAFVKVSVYALIGQYSNNAREHSSLLNTIEGIFMLGVLSGYWLFSHFINPADPADLSWLNVYYLLLAIVLFSIAMVFVGKFELPKSSVKAVTLSRQVLSKDFIDMLKLTYQPLVLVFVLSIFLYVLVEQGIGTWLPTFNNQVLQLPVSVSVQITSIFAASLAVGR